VIFSEHVLAHFHCLKLEMRGSPALPY